jgi:antitoxin (DNA-binding transcriptional repressor) of toxin-antitoxin stability system
MKKVALTDVEGHFAEYLRLAEEEEVVITHEGRAAGILIGFRSEEDWSDFELEQDPRFLQRIELSRKSLREKGGLRLEDLGDLGE